MAGADGVIIRVNSSFAEMLGRTPDQLAGLSIAAISHPDDTLRRTSISSAISPTGEIAGYQLEKRYFHADGHIVWASVSAAAVPDGDGGVRYVISQIEDITERKAIAERIAHQAIHDPMTGLPNRTVFLERLRVALEVARGKGTRVGVIFCDLDHFKWINDTYGHATGDQVLAAVGDRLRSALRPSDSVARFGGDEFTILCGDLVEERDAAHRRRARARGDLRAVPAARRRARTSARASAPRSRAPNPTPPKRSCATPTPRCTRPRRPDGRARCCSTRVGHNTSSVSSLRTGNELHRALDRGEFRVYYQPLTQLSTRRRGRGRGARPLAAPRARPGGAERLRPARRGDGADRAHRSVGPRRGVPPGRRVAAAARTAIRGSR